MKRNIVNRFLMAAFVFLLSANLIQAQQKTAGITPLPNKQVCMITNKFMSKDQIAVPVKGKTYYGCCQMCVGTLTNDDASRHATDPLTDQKVDKADAFIVIKPGTTDDVLYFASKSNAEKYLKTRAGK